MVRNRTRVRYSIFLGWHFHFSSNNIFKNFKWRLNLEHTNCSMKIHLWFLLLQKRITEIKKSYKMRCFYSVGHRTVATSPGQSILSIQNGSVHLVIGFFNSYQILDIIAELNRFFEVVRFIRLLKLPFY